MDFLFKLDTHFFLENGGGEVCDPAAEEVGHQANQQVTDRQRAERQTKGGKAAGDTEVNKQLSGVDVREQAVHRMAAVGGGGVITRLVLFWHKAAEA